MKNSHLVMYIKYRITRNTNPCLQWSLLNSINVNNKKLTYHNPENTVTAQTAIHICDTLDFEVRLTKWISYSCSRKWGISSRFFSAP